VSVVVPTRNRSALLNLTLRDRPWTLTLMYVAIRIGEVVAIGPDSLVDDFAEGYACLGRALLEYRRATCCRATSPSPAHCTVFPRTLT